jgi:hypothetical protein
VHRHPLERLIDRGQEPDHLDLVLLAQDVQGPGAVLPAAPGQECLRSAVHRRILADEASAGLPNTRRYILLVSDGAVPCKTNISPAGRRRRIRFGNQWLVVSAALLVVLVVLRVRWYWGLTMFLPAALSAVGFLQVSRNTCVMRAKEGTFEHEDFSTTKAPDDEVAASRVVAATINRDTILIGLCGAAIGVAAVLLFHRV